MSWKKHLTVVNPKSTSTLHSRPDGSQAYTQSNFSSYLPEVYTGQANRLQRYSQYDDMDRDSVINTALDTLADFCTQNDEGNDGQFRFVFHKQPNEPETAILEAQMKKWSKINNFRSRLWYIFRNAAKYGDQVLIRDPETFELLWVDPYNVESVKVNEERGRTPISYAIKNLDFSKQSKLATRAAALPAYGGISHQNRYDQASKSGVSNTSGYGLASANIAGTQGAGNFGVTEVNADYIVHASMNPGMEANWPFGRSILESVFKVFKQKQLLEDAVIIYRVQRAPERRIFKIDVGDMNPVMANAHIERIKNESHQRRIPNRNGAGGSMMDTAYNPLSMLEDYYFAVTPDGRGSSVEVLPGGDATGNITDLEHFNHELRTALRIPASYMPGSEGTQYFDGKTGSALIQEYQFNKYCMRLQNLLIGVFDKEFKYFLQESGISIDESMFEIEFNPPQNFAAYRQIELDQAKVNIYQGIVDNKILSERFKLMRFLGLTESEILENERLWMEENPHKVKNASGKEVVSDTGEDVADLGSVGISSPDEELTFDEEL